MNDIVCNFNFIHIGKVRKYSNFVPIVVFFIATYLFLEKVNAYHFFYIEQFQLFLTTPLYFVESISHPGGMMEYLARFLIQFFIVPHVAPFLVALFLLLVFHLSNQLFIRLDSKRYFFIAPASVYLFFLFSCFDFNFYLQGILSYILCIWCLSVCITKEDSVKKTIIVILLVPLLYWIAGSVSMLFAVCYSLTELYRKGTGREKIYWLILPVFASLISWLGVRFAFIGDIRMSFFPDMYYQHKLNPGFLIYIPWILLAVWIALEPLMKKISKKQNKRYLLFGFQGLLLLFLFFWGIEKYGDRKFYEIKKMDYYARKGHWDNIIDGLRYNNITDYLSLNYLNLALAQKGLLPEEMFNFNQSGVIGLKATQNDIGLISPLMSDISLCIGDLASCQRYAFEGYEISSGGGNGRMLKRLVQTNLIYGEYAVAEKYINVLEHTLFYKKWARNQRRFLYQDSLCVKDSFIGVKRHCLPPANSRLLVADFPDMLETLVKICPGNEAAKQYLLAFYLLAKDVKGFTHFLSWYRQEKMITELPEIYQQALLVFYEAQPNWWIKEGIDEKTIRQYQNYKVLLLNNIRNKAVKEIMDKNSGSTYWFYLQFS